MQSGVVFAHREAEEEMQTHVTCDNVREIPIARIDAEYIDKFLYFTDRI
jgi:hypothetical protein